MGNLSNSTQNAILEIIRQGQLPSSKQEVLDSLLTRVFAGMDGGLQWATSEWDVLVYMDGNLVSTVGILERTILVGGQSLHVGGISGVATLPEHRKHGYASLAMRRAEAFMRDELHLEYVLLVCGDERVPFYGSLGWQVVEDPMYLDQPDDSKHLFDAVVMILTLAGKPWPKGVIDLCGLPW